MEGDCPPPGGWDSELIGKGVLAAPWVAEKFVWVGAAPQMPANRKWSSKVSRLEKGSQRTTMGHKVQHPWCLPQEGPGRCSRGLGRRCGSLTALGMQLEQGGPHVPTHPHHSSGSRNKKKQKPQHKGTRKRSAFLLQRPSGSLYWQTLALCLLSGRKCIPYTYPRADTEE